MAKGITVPVVQSGLEASIEAAAKKAGPLSLSATVDPSSFKRLAQPLGRVSGLATEFEKSIAASNARVIAFGASVGIINGVQNAFASLVKTTIEVEKSLANIAVISGKSVDELQPFSRALFEIAKNTAQSFQTASEAALEFSRQGLSLDETLKRTQDALTLTRFTSLSAAEAVDVLTAAANSFGETGITTSEILNKLVAVDTKFAVSAEDLAKGLSRAGSIAQEVGVNFDELNAIVTIAQERTARGGAVIGNAFKTIFTRIRSDETVRALQSIGIYSFDAQGRLKPVVSLLEELAGKIGTLSETKRIEVLESIASKYNINVLTALVDDLGSTTSKFRQARDVSAGAQNEAYQRQIQLNQALDAIITRVTNSATQLADTLGKIGVTDSLKSLLNFFDSILTGINDVIDSEGIGGTIAKGLISGLSGVFFKVGIPLLLAIFVKLTKDIAQFGTESLKTILGINKEVRERQALEQAVVNTLIKDQQVMATILSLSGDRRKQEEYLLSVYNRQLAALQQVQSIAAGVTPALQAAGLSATSGTIKKRAAGGYLPAEEAKDVRRGVGGASPSSKVVEIPNFSFGGGKRGTMVANTSEYIVPNYAGGSGTAIFNQDMAKEYGLPPGAKKITASGGFVPASGFVPNFAKQNIEEFKKIAPLSVKEIAIKNSRAAKEKDARFENYDKADENDTFAANIKILRQDKSNADYNKQSNQILKKEIFKNFGKTTGKTFRPEYESLIKKYKDSGVDPQSISRLTTLVDSAQSGDAQAVVNIKSAIKGIEGEIDASKKLKTKIVKGNRYFDLASGEEVKTRATTPASNILKKVANRFLSEKNIANKEKDNIVEQATVILPSDGVISNASKGYIPNFAATTPEELDIYKKFPAAPFPKRDEEGKQVREYRSGFWVDKQRGVRITTDIAKNALTPQQQASLLWIGAGEVDNLKIVSAMPSDGSIGAAMLVPDPEMARQVNAKSMVGGTKTKTKEAKDVAGFVKFRAFGFGGSRVKNQMNKMAEGDAPLVQNIRESMQTAIEQEAIKISALLKPYTFAVPDAAGFREKFKKQPGAAGAVGAAAGAAFEAAMDYAFVTKKSKASQEAIKASAGKTYDVLNFKQSRVLQTAFGVDTSKKGGVEQYADFKISGERDDEFADQVILNRTFVDYAESIKKSKEETAAKGKASEGYIPNYNDPSTSLAIQKISDSTLQGKLDAAAEKAYGGFTEKRPIKAGVSKRFATGTQNTPATLKFREALEKKGAGLEPLLNRPYGFMGLQLSTAPAGAMFSISDPESVRKFNNPFPTEPEASRKPALVAVANYREPTRDEIKKGVKPDVVAPQGQYANVSYATMFGTPVQVPTLGVKSPIKKASFGYVPNFADLFVDYDYTIFGKQVGKVDEFNNQRALIDEITEKEAKGMTKEQLKAREEVRSAAVKKQKDLLTPFGQKLLQSKKPFKLATARWSDYQSGIESSLKGLGFNVNGIFALGREFSEEQYKVDNPKFAEEMKKPEGERNTRVKPRIEPSAAQKKALFFKERAPQIATGDIDFVDNDPANLQAVKSLMPKINTFTPDQYMAKLLAPQEVKGTKASLGYVPNFVSENAKAAIGRLIREGATPGERAAAEAAKERALKQKAGISRSLLTLDDENFLETQGGSIEKAMGFGLNPILEKLQNIRNGEELQNSDSAQIKNLKEKIGIVNLQRVWKMIGNQEGKRLQVQKALIEKRYPTRIQGAALGYIPNFAANDPLKEAISREVSAGVSPARVRVTQDSRLKNRDNPDGLAVINTRDEPNGKIPNDFRERGMRAAMAARGFVPNFALTRDNKTKTPSSATPIIQKFEKDISQIPSFLDQASTERFKSAVSSLIINIKALSSNSELLKSKLEEISRDFALTGQQDKAFRSAVKNATQEIENRKNAEKKAWQETNKQVSSFKPSNITTSGGTSQNQPPIIKPQDKKDVDLGKFLILQSAVTGLTSAFQSATEQGSAAANALEGVSAVASGIATFVSIGSTLNPTLRVLAAGVTTLASAFPLLSRLYEDFKTPADRTAEALAKLGKEAEKTGKRISPEEFLSAFDQEQAKRKEEAIRKTATKQIQEELARMGVAINETDLYSLYSIFSASGQINEQGGVDPAAIAALKEARNPSPSLPERASKITAEQAINTANLLLGDFSILIAALETFFTKKLPENVTNSIAKPLLQETLNRDKVNKSGRQRVLEFQERTRKQARTVPIDPGALAIENRLLQLKFNVLNSIFESGQRISKQYQQDIATINDQNSALERSRTILTETSYAKRQADLDDKKALAERTKSERENLQSLRESLRSLQDKGLGNIFSELNLPDIEKLLKGFNPKEVNSEAFRKAFKDVTKTEQNKEGVDLNAVLPADREAIIAALIAATQKGAEITNDYNSKVAEVARNFNNFRSESEKLNTETTFLNAIIAGTSVQLEGAGEAFSGSRKYAELVSLESEKVKNSFAKQVLANNLAETTAYERISGEAQLIESESNLLQAENQSYNENIKNANILALRRSNLLKLEKSERKAEEENQAAIKNITQNYKADIDSTKRKLEYAQALNAQITQAKVNEKVTAEMNLETQNLITSLREARSRLNNVNIATQNEVLKIGQTSVNDLTSSISRGSALSYLGINAEREAQAIAEVQKQRIGGRDVNKIGTAELYDISKGRNQTIGQNLKITSASLLDQAESIQDILGKSAPKLFADGMAEAMGATINRAQDLKDVLNDIAMNFLKSLQGKFLSGAANSASALIFSGFSNIGGSRTEGGGGSNDWPSGGIKPPRDRLAKGGYIKGYASGGFVTGGSGYKDDVPAMLSQGEYVIRKSSVLKYGADNLQKLNSGEAPKFATGGIFLPGVRGQKEISGYKDLTAFAKQTTTSGATDVLTGGASTAFVNLEDQSQRLSAYALLNQDDTINEEIRTAQEQALNIIKEREAYRTQKRKAFQQQLIGTGISAAVNFGVGYLGNLATRSATSALDKEAAKVIGESGFDYSKFGSNSYNPNGSQVTSDLTFGNFMDGAAGVLNSSRPQSPNIPRRAPQRNQRRINRMLGTRQLNYGLRNYPSYPDLIAYGGMIPRFADGGSPRDKVPALLMEGEYVMSDKATRKYGKQFFDSINQGRAPRFADGGQVSTAEPSFAEKAAAMSDSKAAGATNISININVTGESSQMQTEGDTKQKGADYKQMSKQIEQIVLKTIAEQKRAGGMLKPNR